MIKILDSSGMKACDNYTINALGIPSRELMERAAEACVSMISDGRFDLGHVTAVCGTGNNGGDGMAIALMLARRGISVDVVFSGNKERCSPEAAFRLCELIESGIKISPRSDFSDSTLIIDALFGIGLSRNIDGEYAEIIDSMNRSGKSVFAVDIPSGISADTGAVMGCAVRADETAAISNMKRGHVFYPGCEYAGRITVCDIGIPSGEAKDAIYALGDGDLAPIRARAAYSNKGSFGRVLIAGGSVGMAGAAYLSALAAYRSGAGLCDILSPEENRIILQTLLPEAVLSLYGASGPEETLKSALEKASCVVVGPGLGQGDTAKRIVKYIFENARVPIICDADALNITASLGLCYPSNVPVTVTPHLGEMARLTGIAIDRIKKSLCESAQNYAKAHGVICLLKDARSVISDGKTTFVNTSGTSAMAKGGSGDVLTGVIAALTASGADPLHAAAYGAYLHGKAGERAAKDKGIHALLARDIANAIER